MSVKEKILSGRRPLPILAYPAVVFTGETVGRAVRSARVQAELMTAAAEHCESAAAVAPMDLSVEAECFGSSLAFFEDSVPAVEGSVIKTPADALKAEVPQVGSCRSGEFIEAVRLAKAKITDRPVLAGVSGPFSLAARLIGVSESMLMCFDEPEAVECTAEKCTRFIIDYIKAFRDAGADGVILAEPVAGLLSPAMEKEFSAPFIKMIAEQTQSADFSVIYHNCGAAVNRMADSVFSNGCDAYHFGNACDLPMLIEKAPEEKLVMGNLDPIALFKDGTPDEMKKAVGELAALCGGHGNFVLSSGCDIPAAAKWENIEAFFAAARQKRFEHNMP